MLDIGINYYGWSDEEALEYWKENIVNQDEKAMREINRMKRWPAQVLTYKIGAAKILEIKEKFNHIMDYLQKINNTISFDDKVKDLVEKNVKEREGL